MSSMTNYNKEQINRRLALLCGVDQQMLGWWDEYEAAAAEYKAAKRDKAELMDRCWELQLKLDGFELDNYYHDLNAMFKAERALVAKSRKLFDDYIRAIYTAVDAMTTNGEVGLEVLDPFEVTVVMWRYADAPTKAEAMYSILVNQPVE